MKNFIKCLLISSMLLSSTSQHSMAGNDFPLDIDDVAKGGTRHFPVEVNKESLIWGGVAISVGVGAFLFYRYWTKSADADENKISLTSTPKPDTPTFDCPVPALKSSNTHTLPVQEEKKESQNSDLIKTETPSGHNQPPVSLPRAGIEPRESLTTAVISGKDLNFEVQDETPIIPILNVSSKESSNSDSIETETFSDNNPPLISSLHQAGTEPTERLATSWRDFDFGDEVQEKIPTLSTPNVLSEESSTVSSYSSSEATTPSKPPHQSAELDSYTLYASLKLLAEEQAKNKDK